MGVKAGDEMSWGVGLRVDYGRKKDFSFGVLFGKHLHADFKQ